VIQLVGDTNTNLCIILTTVRCCYRWHRRISRTVNRRKRFDDPRTRRPRLLQCTSQVYWKGLALALTSTCKITTCTFNRSFFISLRKYLFKLKKFDVIWRSLYDVTFVCQCGSTISRKGDYWVPQSSLATWNPRAMLQLVARIISIFVKIIILPISSKDERHISQVIWMNILLRYSVFRYTSANSYLFYDVFLLGHINCLCCCVGFCSLLFIGSCFYLVFHSVYCIFPTVVVRHFLCSLTAFDCQEIKVLLTYLLTLL